jgi:hypothetical protein
MERVPMKDSAPGAALFLSSFDECIGEVRCNAERADEEAMCDL